MSNIIEKHTCRLCGSNELWVGLKLNPTPPANEFVKSTEYQELYPLDVCECKDCGHIQLKHVVDPSLLFKNYVYVSGTSPSFVKHFDDYAKSVLFDFDIKPGDKIVEIGSNDGTLLGCFAKYGIKRNDMYGFEPACKIAAKSEQVHRVNIIPEFFNDDTVSVLVNKIGKNSVKLIVANNVFAHIDNLEQVVDNIDILLSNDGVFVFEVSYFIEVYRKCLFDTIYHEHLSYHTLLPLIDFFSKLGLNLFDAEIVNTHGGSIRCFVDKCVRPDTDRLQTLCDEEYKLGFSSPHFTPANPLTLLSHKIDSLKVELKNRLNEIKNNGKSIIGYGAPAKITTLMYHFDIDKSHISYIIDDNPLKQGTLTPGKHISVYSSDTLKHDKPDYILILAWNFAESIIKNNHEFQESGGKFIIPIPKLIEC